MHASCRTSCTNRYLGPRQGVGGPPPLLLGHRHPSLLLWSPRPLAARIEREHQWLAAAVLSEKHRRVWLFAGPAASGGETLERTATQGAELRDADRAISPDCCIGRLKPPPYVDTSQRARRGARSLGRLIGTTPGLLAEGNVVRRPARRRTSLIKRLASRKQRVTARP